MLIPGGRTPEASSTLSSAAVSPDDNYCHDENKAPVTVEVTSPVVVRCEVARRPTERVDYMFPAILTCFCGFWPTALCAIYCANKSNEASASGNKMAAHSYARLAKHLILVSVVVGILEAAILVGVTVLLSRTTSSPSYSSRF